MMNVLEQWIIIYPARALTGPRDGKADKEKENSIAKKSLQSLLTFHPPQDRFYLSERARMILDPAYLA